VLQIVLLNALVHVVDLGKYVKMAKKRVEHVNKGINFIGMEDSGQRKRSIIAHIRIKKATTN